MIVAVCLLGLVGAAPVRAGWFSPPIENETESDIIVDVEQVAFRRTAARMTGDATQLALLAQRELVLTLRMRVARGRAARDAARQRGDKKLAERFERDVNAAKRELATMAAQAYQAQ